MDERTINFDALVGEDDGEGAAEVVVCAWDLLVGMQYHDGAMGDTPAAVVRRALDLAKEFRAQGRAHVEGVG